jgi:hypothetical protein
MKNIYDKYLNRELNFILLTQDQRNHMNQLGI